MSAAEFPVTYDEHGAHVVLPEVCEVCGEGTIGVWDTHMVMCHPETRLNPDFLKTETKRKKKK